MEQVSKKQDHLLNLSELRFLLIQPSDLVSHTEKEEIVQKIKKIVVENEMSPILKNLQHHLAIEKSIREDIEKKNNDTIAKLEAKIKDVEENFGENEVREALLAKAQYYHKIGDKKLALEGYDKAFTKTVALGQKIDILFSKTIITLAFDDLDLAKKFLEELDTLIEKGGDWERRNKYKVFKGLYLLAIRDFAGACALFLDGMSTFTTSEALPYPRFVFYSILVSLFSLKRKDLKKKLINSPDVLSVAEKVPAGIQLMNSLYNCQYGDFLKALSQVSDEMKKDKYLNRHEVFYLREMRVIAYSQVLQSYKSVTLKNLSELFSVSEEFIDKELSKFIASGRLNAKIDKVGGIVESHRSDFKNQYYSELVKHGDLLLNRIQKVSRVIDM